jgi:hypothetical protein
MQSQSGRSKPALPRGCKNFDLLLNAAVKRTPIGEFIDLHQIF